MCWTNAHFSEKYVQYIMHASPTAQRMQVGARLSDFFRSLLPRFAVDGDARLQRSKQRYACKRVHRTILSSRSMQGCHVTYDNFLGLAPCKFLWHGFHTGSQYCTVGLTIYTGSGDVDRRVVQLVLGLFVFFLLFFEGALRVAGRVVSVQIICLFVNGPPVRTHI